jgi:hypothetical protein
MTKEEVAALLDEKLKPLLNEMQEVRKVLEKIQESLPSNKPWFGEEKIETNEVEAKNEMVNDFWSVVLRRINLKLSKPSFETWFKNTTAEITDNTVIVYANNEFAVDWLQERYLNLITETIREVIGQVYTIHFSTNVENKQN